MFGMLISLCPNNVFHMKHIISPFYSSVLLALWLIPFRLVTCIVSSQRYEAFLRTSAVKLHEIFKIFRNTTDSSGTADTRLFLIAILLSFSWYFTPYCYWKLCDAFEFLSKQDMVMFNNWLFCGLAANKSQGLKVAGRLLTSRQKSPLYRTMEFDRGCL